MSQYIKAPNLKYSEDRNKLSMGSPVGREAVRLMQEGGHTTVEQIIEEYGDEYCSQIEECIRNNSHKYNDIWHIVVLHKKEPLFCNVLRNWFCNRETLMRPEDARLYWPNHSHTVYQVSNKTGNLKILWTLPTDQDSQTILKNPHTHDPQLVGWIRSYYQGKLGRQLENP